MMEFKVGETYEFSGDLGKVVFKFLEEQNEAWKCELIGGNMANIGKVGTIRTIYKESRIFNTYEVVKVGNLDFGKTSGTIKKRRTPSEIEMDYFLNGILLKGTVNRLKIEIDKALESGNKAVFMALTKELQKLTKKEVRA